MNKKCLDIYLTLRLFLELCTPYQQRFYQVKMCFTRVGRAILIRDIFAVTHTHAYLYKKFPYNTFEVGKLAHSPL